MHACLCSRAADAAASSAAANSNGNGKPLATWTITSDNEDTVMGTAAGLDEYLPPMTPAAIAASQTGAPEGDGGRRAGGGGGLVMQRSSLPARRVQPVGGSGRRRVGGAAGRASGGQRRALGGSGLRLLNAQRAPDWLWLPPAGCLLRPRWWRQHAPLLP